MAVNNKVPDNLNYLANISFRLTMEDSPNITWFCQAVNIPGVSIDGLDVQTPHATVPFGGSKVSFEELTVRFIVDILSTVGLVLMFGGTFAGMVAGLLGGIFISIFLFVYKRTFGYQKPIIKKMKLKWVDQDAKWQSK